MKRSSLIYTLLPFIFLGPPWLLPAQPAPVENAGAGPPTFFQFLQEQSVTQITLTTDFATLVSERNVPHELEGTVHLENEAGLAETLSVKVELRGKTRRNMCEMPPLKLNFGKGELKSHGLNSKGDKLKLVTHCKSSLDRELLLKEYWSYRLYNAITPSSFKVHLLRIKYVDAASAQEIQEEYLGFLIESAEEMGIRIEAEDVEQWGLLPDQVDRQSFNRNLLFQYMIGNDDWDLNSCRNLKLFEPLDGGTPIVVPYDFDYSGLVDAPYAKPNSVWGKLSVTDRVAMGQFESREDLQSLIHEFLDLKDTSLKCYQECTFLSDRTKKRMDKYLEIFFKDLENVKKMDRMFLDKSR